MGRDLDNLADYIARNNLDAAIRLLNAAEATFQELADNPDLGFAYESRSEAAAGLRVWRVRGFRKYLIFYRPTQDGIDVVRVLHGARDLDAIFEGD